jgi:methyltransferase (TIGR00027 family)
MQPIVIEGIMAIPASETAVGPMTIVAAEQYEPEALRLVQDALAYHVLPRSVQRIVRLTRWRPMRNLLFALTEKTAHGIWGSVLCRKRYIDDTLQESLGAVDALLNLGAGFDTRAYRLPGLATLPVFEVDSPENIAAKRASLQALYGRLPDAVRLVPIDFERQDLATALSDHGYRAELKTFFVWEAVTQYLHEEAVRNTFDFLARAASGSRLVFTYIRKDFLDGVELYGAAPTYQRFRVKQQLWHFGLDPEQVGAFLSEYGWRELEQMGSAEFTARYIRPSGRVMSISEMERAVYAEKR